MEQPLVGVTLEGATGALRILSISLSSLTALFQSLQFSFMIQGAPTQLMFEVIWFLFVLIYPVGTLVLMTSPQVEQSLLTNQFWSVYISAGLYSLLTAENYDLMFGEASQALKITSNDTVKSMTVTSTVFASLCIVSYTVYSMLAVETYSSVPSYLAV